MGVAVRLGLPKFDCGLDCRAAYAGLCDRDMVPWDERAQADVLLP
jgi:hypothetical protein